MISEIALKQTSLYKEHLLLNAKMVAFGGWDMPLQYEGILAEYHATRKAVSVFDTSHMGEFFVDGDEKECGLGRLVTQKLDDLKVGQCRYGALLNDDAKVLDDLIVYRLAAQKWMIVVNGATTEKDSVQFKKVINVKGHFVDQSAKIGKLDIQGPQSLKLLSQFIQGIEILSYYSFAELNVLGTKAIVSRTGYTGELGYEIYFPWDRLPELWNKILELGAKPAGLGARDVLRLEMGYSLYGHELSEDISPLEAGLNRFIDWDKDFIGKDALLKEKQNGSARQLISFISLNRKSPRSDFKIYSSDGRELGVVTSGTYSPALQRGIGLGLIRASTEFAKKGQNILVGDGKNNFAAEITSRPFYKNGTYKGV